MRLLGADEIKSVELSIVKELDRICRANDLSYCLAYGTALGAVRHGGFIPWDDDIDVFMPRPDYERLFEVFAAGVDTPYKLVSYRDQTSIYQFAKLVDTSTKSYETFVGKSHPIGLWVDIFPIEPVTDPSSDEVKKALKRNNSIGLARSFAVADTNVASTPMIGIIKKIVCPFARHLNVAKLNEKLDTNAKAIAEPELGDHAPYYIDVLGEARAIKGDFLFPSVDIPFEDAILCGPAKPIDYLEFQYGNWQELPPVEQRAIHFPEAYKIEEN